MEQVGPVRITSWLDEVPCAHCGEYIEKGQDVYPGGLCACCHYQDTQEEQGHGPDRQ